MKHSEKSGIIKNVSSSWLGLLVNVATGIIISPYILHKLGDDAFGLWVLVFAITGYYGLFDFGIRSSEVCATWMLPGPTRKGFPQAPSNAGMSVVKATTVLSNPSSDPKRSAGMKSTS